MCWGCAGGLCLVFVFSLGLGRHIKNEVAENAAGARFESGRGADGIVYAIGLLYRCSGDNNSSLARGEQQDTLSATALPSERPVALPTVWETAEAGHWGCVGTHSSWQKAKRSTSSGKMLWLDCEGVLSLSAKCCLVHLHARAAATTSLRAGKHC